MESVVEDVEDEGETDGSPPNSKSCKNFVVWNVLSHSGGVDQTDGVQGIRTQHDDDIDSQADKTVKAI